MRAANFGFGIWCAMGVFFIALGIYALFSPKAVGFWANARMFPVTDVKKYNRAMFRLFSVTGIIFVLLGLPLLMENSAWILLSCVGVVAEMIAAMIVYTSVIERKYKKK